LDISCQMFNQSLSLGTCNCDGTGVIDLT
jgi:hypothetical protein